MKKYIYCVVIVSSDNNAKTAVIAGDPKLKGMSLSKVLSRGWIPVRENPMGGTGERLCSLILMEKEGSPEDFIEEEEAPAKVAKAPSQPAKAKAVAAPQPEPPAPAPPQPAAPQPAKAQPAKAQPAKAQPAAAQPATAQPAKAAKAVPAAQPTAPAAAAAAYDPDEAVDLTASDSVEGDEEVSAADSDISFDFLNDIE